jgi:heme-degrading monooxygenase HmoA
MVREKIMVIVYYRKPEATPPAIFEQAYRRASATLHGTTGLISTEFLRSAAGHATFALLLKWEDIGAFHAWEREMRAQGHPSPLRRYQDRSRPGGHYEIYAVADADSPDQSAGR